MRISKERLDRIKARVKGHLKSHGGSYKSSLYAGGTGAGAYFGSKALVNNLEFVRSTWWALPGIMAVAGHYLARKNQAVGFGLLGAAGYNAALAYDMKRQAAAAQQTKGLDDAAALADQVWDSQQPAAASGYDDAATLQEIQAAALQDAQAAQLPEASDAGAFEDAAATFDEVSALE